MLYVRVIRMRYRYTIAKPYGWLSKSSVWQYIHVMSWVTKLSIWLSNSVPTYSWHSPMITKRYGNALHITCHLWGKPPVIRGYPSQRASDVELSGFLHRQTAQTQMKIALRSPVWVTPIWIWPSGSTHRFSALLGLTMAGQPCAYDTGLVLTYAYFLLKGFPSLQWWMGVGCGWGGGLGVW